MSSLVGVRVGVVEEVLVEVRAGGGLNLTGVPAATALGLTSLIVERPASGELPLALLLCPIDGGGPAAPALLLGFAAGVLLADGALQHQGDHAMLVCLIDEGRGGDNGGDSVGGGGSGTTGVGGSGAMGGGRRPTGMGGISWAAVANAAWGEEDKPARAAYDGAFSSTRMFNN